MSATPSAPVRGYGPALLGAGLHAVLLSGFLAYVCWRVPDTEQTFDLIRRIGEIPDVTRFVLAIPDNCRVVAPLLPLIPVLDFAFIQLLGRRGREVQAMWVWLMAVLSLALGFVFVFVGIELPLMKVTR
jgi:hypothetical protein